MRRCLVLSLFIFLCSFSLIAAQDKWNISKGTHFIVYFKNAPESFIQKVIDNAENYYNEIADNLGFRRYNFWLWDNRARIYIYDDAQDYCANTGQPSWSGGCANIKDKIIHTFPFAKGFFETVLPHEMGHIIFREFVGFDNNAIPLWLDEGVASYQQDLRNSTADKIVKDAIKKGEFIGLDSLSNINPHTITDTNKVNLFYAESVSMVDFLIKKFGQDSFIYFCQQLRDKKDFSKALASAYPFKDIQELNESWLHYLK